VEQYFKPTQDSLSEKTEKKTVLKRKEIAMQNLNQL
jgi:hypothetical protein